MKVQPTTPDSQVQEIHARRSTFTIVNRLLHFWHRTQIGHRSEYSIERLLAFRDYYRRTSITRAVAVCILTPIPAVTVALLIDCTPLRSPSEGWQANYAFWVRWFLALVAVSLGVTAQVREVILPGTISNAGATAIALGTAVTDASVAMAVAVLWRFPIPFGYIFMVGPYLVIILCFTLLVVGRRLLAESPVLRQQIKSQATIIFAQGAVAMAYPVFTAVFYRLSGPQQTVFVIIMPIFKHMTRHIIANAAGGLHEYVGPIVVFSVDVFNVFYVATCMQKSKTMLTTVFIIASDSLHVIVALRDIFHQADVVKTSQGDEQSHAINYLEDLLGMVHNVFRDPQTLAHGCRIRVFAPFSLSLSDESTSFVNAISGPNAQQVTEATSSIENASTPKQEQVSQASSTPSTLHPGSLYDKENGSAIRNVSDLMHTDTEALALPRTTTQEAVWVALQALFHSEYVLMAEYIECALPILYAMYLAILFHLPVASYYPQTASSTPTKLNQDVINILSFSAVELAGFVCLLLLLRRKFGISPLYQLAFVLETQMLTVQGHLFVWTIFILHMPLMHYDISSELSTTMDYGVALDDAVWVAELATYRLILLHIAELVNKQREVK